VPLDAFALALTAAIAHAFWNRRLHVTGDRLATIAVANLAMGLALAPAALLWPPWRVWPLIVLSAVAEAVYCLCLTAAYRRGALAVAYPLGRGTAPLLITLGGWLVLAERPSPAVLAGTVLLAVGMALVATAGWRAGQGGAVGFAALTGIGIAAYSLIDARAVRVVPVAGYFGVVSLLAGTILTGLLLTGVVRGDSVPSPVPFPPFVGIFAQRGVAGMSPTLRLRTGLGRLRRSLGPGLRVAVGAAAAYLLVLLAFQRADAGRVAALRESSILIAIWLAGERPGRRIWLGAALIVVGIALAAVL
jgi:drug/metabolite transporter (DMT)-like permease